MLRVLLATFFFLYVQSEHVQWTYTTPNNTDLFLNGTLQDSRVDSQICDSTKQLSGYFKISGSKTKNYFYWFFESRSNPSSDPVMIWLTGGPGCSSMLALLGENGPCSVNKDLSTKVNPFSWNSNANIMWIDQPAGVGFSYGDVSEYDTDEKMVGDDLFHFLQAFFQVHPEYSKQEFYTFGESYGGHYVPAISHRIFIANQRKEGLHINLKGVGIGNGLTDPQIQYQYYPKMAYNNTYGVKAVSKAIYTEMEASVPRCTSLIKICQTTKAFCVAAELYCNTKLVAPFQTSGLNVYDVRKKCGSNPLCYDFSSIEKFLRLDSTRKALGVSKKSAKWKSCNMRVHAGFTYDWMRNFDQLVAPMLEGGIRVLVYAGDADFIVNWMGCKAWTIALDWKGKKDFSALKDKDWILNGKSAGKVRSVKGFTFLQVYNAGHMVPMDQPENSLEMLKQFTMQKKFTVRVSADDATVVVKNDETAMM